MPPKNQKPNAFMIFALEWRSKHGKRLSMGELIKEAGEVWKNMDEKQRAPYKDRAKEELIMSSRAAAEKLTCTGMPVSQVEKQKMDHENKERQMKRDIESTVSKSVKNDNLEKQSYYFIMVNYFTKTLKGGVYVPAELAVCKFSLLEGVSRVYHTLINPGVNIYGHQYEAQHHADTTHNLPLPPMALGDKNLGNIYNEVLNFIRDPETNSYSPLYTLKECIHIVDSVLEFLKADNGANNLDLKIYPIQYLFYIMKEATCEVGEIEKPSSFYITDAYFERDFYEYQIGIGCQFHEKNDRCKYCTQSYVTRWGYMFCDYMCRDLAIRLEPGRHCPINTNLNAIITPAPSRNNDTESIISMSNASTHTNPVAGSKYYYDDQKTSISDATNKTYTQDFPSLGARKAKKKSPLAEQDSPVRHKSSRQIHESVFSVDNDDDDDDDLNPWNSRSQCIPREPDNSHFDIEYGGLNSSDADDCNSVSSFGRGRGRGSLVNSFSSVASSRGRGSYFRN
ncbi:protein maelstrom 1 [Stomoxys calcitrans]|uniref:protein maelstrom 1 n=1 Tax=Stomoxys calcitrans TaxID=35570 RepID=UPI0027E29CE4|nr:protein maelstrom 1 [Stomoxys calcitrans]